MICGYCQGEVTVLVTDPGRCPCGRRAISPLPGGTLVHVEGCDGAAACPCFQDFARMHSRMDALVAELERRIASVHERVECPKCGAQAGDRCVRVNSRSAKKLKHSHEARVRADGIPLR